MAITKNNQASLPYKPYSDQANWSNTYLTDPALLKALGRFDLDVCCPPEMPWKTARTMYHDGTVDALAVKWPAHKRTWMNPPYRGVIKWIRRFIEQERGIALLNGRSVETDATQLAMENSTGVFFPNGRLTFYDAKGEPYRDKTGAIGKWLPSVLIGLSEDDADALRSLPTNGFPGVFLLGPKGETR